MMQNPSLKVVSREFFNSSIRILSSLWRSMIPWNSFCLVLNSVYFVLYSLMISKLLPVNFFSASVSETKKLTNLSWKRRKGSIYSSSKSSKGDVTSNCSKGKIFVDMLLSIDTDWFRNIDDSIIDFCSPDLNPSTFIPSISSSSSKKSYVEINCL